MFLLIGFKKVIDMDAEEEKVLYLSRVGRDKIFKYGTYNMVQERAITQDHPFYVKREDHLEKISPSVSPDAMQSAPSYESAAPVQEETSSAVPPPPPPPSDDDAAALAAQMISSNFKVGLSQEEVDALLNGMG